MLATKDSPATSGGHLKQELSKLAAKINQRERVAVKSALQHAKEQGDDLINARASLPPRGFTPWLRENFQFSKVTAFAYIKIAQYWERISKGTLPMPTTIAGALRMISTKDEEDASAPEEMSDGNDGDEPGGTVGEGDDTDDKPTFTEDEQVATSKPTTGSSNDTGSVRKVKASGGKKAGPPPPTSEKEIDMLVEGSLYGPLATELLPIITTLRSSWPAAESVVVKALRLAVKEVGRG